ncbi:MAG: ATP-binding protein [Deltaproteobacteria bacterium]|nr:ATP-binding protein [Deltaproteobacteria bacterium]
MIDSLYLKNYGCIQEATFKLSSIHALIGPNDSGKSTVLRALRTLTTNGGTNDHYTLADERELLKHALLANITNDPTVLTASYKTAKQRLTAPQHHTGQSQPIAEYSAKEIPTYEPGWLNHFNNFISPAHNTLKKSLQGSILFRLDPDALRQPVNLIPDNVPLRFQDPRGLGLPGIYDAILKRDTAAYSEISQNLSELFTSVKQIRLTNPTYQTTALGIQLHDGTAVKAEFMSEGMLYYLAYAALDYLDPVRMLLIEEPENGLHPARIADVMRILRHISDKTQVVLSTHSPLVINELKGDEVSVITREQKDNTTTTKVTLLKDTPNYEQRARVYATGELWLSYADGELESPLLSPEQS